MSITIHDIGVIDRRIPPPERLAGLFAGAVDGDHDVVLTGADGRAWWGQAIASADVVLAFWTSPSQPIVVYGGDPSTLADRIHAGTLVVLAGGGLELELNPAWSRLQDLPAAATAIFGQDVIVCTEGPAIAAQRLVGPPGEAGDLLGVIGATVTILARRGSEMNAALKAVGARPPSCLTVTGDATSRVVLGLAWTRALGAFQIRSVDRIDGLEEVLAGSLGDVAVVLGPESARARAAELLTDEHEIFDLVAAADPGGVTTFITDLVSAFGDGGDVLLTGSTVPARPVLVLRGAAAEAAHGRLELPRPKTSGPVFTATAAESVERYEAHQWVGSMRRASEVMGAAWPVGGPTLASEARSAGLVWPPDADAATGRVDGHTLARIVRARGWHVIDPEIPPVLDEVLLAARAQLVGGESAIPASQLHRLTDWASKPGFWPDLLSAVEPPQPTQIVIPYPPASVEILRAVVASGGSASELRAWMGPVKTAIFRGLRGTTNE